jgi:hypothetical protein
MAATGAPKINVTHHAGVVHECRRRSHCTISSRKSGSRISAPYRSIRFCFPILASASAFGARQTNNLAGIITKLERAGHQIIIADRGRKSQRLPSLALPPAMQIASRRLSLSLDCTLLLPNPLERRSTETVVPSPRSGWCRVTTSRKIQVPAMAQHAAPICIKRNNRGAAKRIANKAMSRHASTIALAIVSSVCVVMF